MAAPKKTVTIHVRVDEDTAEALQRVADAEDRKLSNLAARILKQWVEERKK
jgi:predicted transcriptional regulator